MRTSPSRLRTPAPDRAALTAAEQTLIDNAIRCLEGRYQVAGEPLTSPAATRDYLKLRLYGLPREVFACLFLDNRHRLIAYEELFYGTLDGASVHPREVVRRALELRAAALIFAHNHPSGVAEPSQADLHITRRLKDALALVEIRVVDHVIIGEGAGTSFAEQGLL